MPTHKDKFLQTVLGRNEALEKEVKYQNSSIHTLQLEIQRLQSIIQSHAKAAEAKDDSLAKMEQHLQLQAKDNIIQRRVLNEQVLTDQKLITDLNEKRLELDNSQKQIIYLTKLLRLSNSDSPSAVNEKLDNTEFKSFVDLCLLLKVFSQNGSNDSKIPCMDLDSHTSRAIKETVIKLQRNNQMILKELERLLNFCHDNIVNRSLHDRLKSVFNLLLTSHVSIGYIYKETGESFKLKEEMQATQFQQINPMQVEAALLASTMSTTPNIELDALSATPSLTTVDNGNSFMNLPELSSFGSNSITSNASLRKLSEPILLPSVLQQQQQHLQQQQQILLDDQFSYTHLPINDQIGQLHADFKEKVLLNDQIAFDANADISPINVGIDPMLSLNSGVDPINTLYNSIVSSGNNGNITSGFIS